MKRTHEQFVKEMSVANPKMEILGHYKGANYKLQVKCIDCGNIWEVRASHLLEGQGCPVCSKNKSRKRQAKTTDQFISELKTVNPNIEVLGQYINAFTPIQVRCSVCGYRWETQASNLTRGTGCPQCAIERARKKSRRKKTHEEYVHEVHTSNPNIELLNTYTGSRGIMKCKCSVCGRVWNTRADNVISRGCPTCNNKRTTPRKKTHVDFEAELAEANPNVIVLGKYIGTDTPISVKCKLCGHLWKPTPYNLLAGHKCPQCMTKQTAENAKKTQAVFIEQVKQLNPNIEIIGKYNGAANKVKVKCNICNHVWMANPSHLVRDRGCPKCSDYLQTSFPEQCLFYYVHQLFPDTVNDFQFQRKRFDIYIPSLQTAIEYDGSKWHSNTEKDIEKNNIIAENNLRIIRVRESGLPPIKGSVNVFREHNKSDSDLERCVKDVLEILHPNANISVDIERDRNTIRSLYLLTENVNYRINHQLEEIDSDWELIEFQGTQKPVRVRCRKCGVEANKSFYRLMAGDNCSRCKRERAFILKLLEKNPSISVIGRYEGSEKRIEVECKKCGCHWSATPHYLLKGMKCPNNKKHQQQEEAD